MFRCTLVSVEDVGVTCDSDSSDASSPPRLFLFFFRNVKHPPSGEDFPFRSNQTSSVITSYIITCRRRCSETVNLALLWSPQPWHSSWACFQTVSHAFQPTSEDPPPQQVKAEQLKQSYTQAAAWLILPSPSFLPVLFCTVFIIIRAHARGRSDGTHQFCSSVEMRDTSAPRLLSICQRWRQQTRHATCNVSSSTNCR